MLPLAIFNIFLDGAEKFVESRIGQIAIASVIFFGVGYENASLVYRGRERAEQLQESQALAAEHARREIVLEDAQAKALSDITDLKLQNSELDGKLKDVESASHSRDQSACLDADSVLKLDAIQRKQPAGRRAGGSAGSTKP
jgi:hypothetical protein